MNAEFAHTDVEGEHTDPTQCSHTVLPHLSLFLGSLTVWLGLLCFVGGCVVFFKTVKSVFICSSLFVTSANPAVKNRQSY